MDKTACACSRINGARNGPAPDIGGQAVAKTGLTNHARTLVVKLPTQHQIPHGSGVIAGAQPHGLFVNFMGFEQRVPVQLLGLAGFWLCVRLSGVKAIDRSLLSPMAALKDPTRYCSGVQYRALISERAISSGTSYGASPP